MHARGHEVHVVCSRRASPGGPLYAPNERRDGVLVHRLAALRGEPRRLATRVADQVAFLGLALARAARLPRPDLVLALSSPPFVGAAGKLLALRHRAAHAHWVMDVY